VPLPIPPPVRRKVGNILAAVLIAFSAAPLPARAGYVRIKDITETEGVRANQLIGYGLVVGLNGTGDRLTNSIFTRETLISMLNRLGVNIRNEETQLQTHDVAAVMVTADLPAFSHSGNRIDVTVSAAGDSSSLLGGTLLVTPLMAADGEVYAVAQGALAANSFSARGAAAEVTRNVPTTAHVANGAIVEREIPFDLGARTHLHMSLRNPDLTTATRIAAAIAQAVGPIATVDDPRTVELDLTGRDAVSTLARIGDLPILPDTPAKVVIDEASGTIIMGADVHISTVAVAQGNLTVQVSESPEVSQPGPLSNGQTTSVPRTNIGVTTGANRRMAVLRGGATLRDLVTGLNALGVGPRDMISILQTIKADGALQADLETR
jgi:flagellar P-ring protein FlgI